MPKDKPRTTGDKKSRHSKDTWSHLANIYDPLKIGSIDGTDTEPHDNGIWRALHSVYVPNKHVFGNPHHTIFIAKLNPRTTQDTIVEQFSKHGKIVSSRLVRDIVTGKSKCYAFVEYDSTKSARAAYKEMHQEFIDNSEILVEFELERTMPGWKPRRFGGGFGGNKESGQLRFGCRERPFLKPIIVNMKPQRDNDRSRNEYRSERR